MNKSTVPANFDRSSPSNHVDFPNPQSKLKRELGSVSVLPRKQAPKRVIEARSPFATRHRSSIDPQANYETKQPIQRDLPKKNSALWPVESRYHGPFRSYGNFTMAYTTLQPGMKYFDTRSGYLAFDTYFGSHFVLGDPIGKPEDHTGMIRDFLEQHPNTCFCQISENTGAILNEMGWCVNEMGADIQIKLQDYDFDGPKKSKLRQAARKIEREGYSIGEIRDAEIDPHAVDGLCSSWLSTKSVRREARFLVRPLQYNCEPGVRKFYLMAPNGELTSFVAFDPICEGGAVIGYSPSIKRRALNSPVGAEEAITKFAIETFQTEGYKILNLGLVPLYDVQKPKFQDAWAMRKFFQFLLKYGDRWIYNFQGHADFKRRYRGEIQKVYLGTHYRWRNAVKLVGLMRLCNIF